MCCNNMSRTCCAFKAHASDRPGAVFILAAHRHASVAPGHHLQPATLALYLHTLILMVLLVPASTTCTASRASASLQDLARSAVPSRWVLPPAEP